MFQALKSPNPRALLLTGLVAAIPILVVAARPAVKDSAQSPRPTQSYANLPLSFEANQGQFAGQVHFLSRGSGYSLYLTNSAAVLALTKPASNNSALKGDGFSRRTAAPNDRDALQAADKPALDGFVKGHDFSRADKAHKISRALAPEAADTIQMQLSGANPSATLSGQDQLPGVSNYFLGNDPAKWRTNVPTYAKVRYTGVYPGIDLIYYGNQRQLEYDFVVAPNANAHSIRLTFTGQDHLNLAPNGDLILQTSSGQATLHKPVVYQEKDGQRQPIPATFQLAANHAVRFQIGNYDHTRPLVIDPILVYSTYLGGSGNYFGGDQANGIAVDEEGSAYVVGTAFSSDFPVTAGAYASRNKGLAYLNSNVFIAKFNAAGTALVYSTYLGGSGIPVANSGFGDTGTAIAVDASGSAYVTGQTVSKDFPTTKGAFQTANTYLGNALDATAFVTKLNATGSALEYSTYLGDNSSSPGDAAAAIAVDTAGNAYIAGQTYSTAFPVTKGAFQTVNHGVAFGVDNAFIAKLNPTGSALVFSTYLGGTQTSGGFYGGDAASSIAIDPAGDVYVAGTARTIDFPTTKGAFQTVNTDGPYNPTGFISKLNSTGTALSYSTFLGGTQGDGVNAIAIDAAGDAFVAGFTGSSDFPVTKGAFLSTASLGFVTKLNPAGSALLYSTYLQGQANGLALNSTGDAYVAGFTLPSYVSYFDESFNAITPNLTSTVSQYYGQYSYLLKMNATGTAPMFATLLGGYQNDLSSIDGAAPDAANAVAVDAAGSAYIAGLTYATDLPITPGAFQTTNNGTANFTSNAYVGKLALPGVTANEYRTVTSVAVSPSNSQPGQTVTLTAKVSQPAAVNIPTGSVTFSLAPYFVGPPVQPSAALDKNGSATWSSANLAGNYTATAIYRGDASDLSSMTANPVSFTALGPPASINGYPCGVTYGQSPFQLSVVVDDIAYDPLPGFTVNFSGSGLLFTPTSAVTDADGNAFTEVSASKAGNFTVSAAVKGTSLSAAIPCSVYTAPLTVSLNSVSRYYGYANPTLTYVVSGLVGKDTVTVAPSTVATKSSPVGSYDITATVTGAAAANYSVSVNDSTLNVLDAPLAVTARNVSSVYGQAPPTLTYSLTGFVNGDTASVVSGAPLLTTSVKTSTPVGSYPISVSPGTLAAANYFFNTTPSGQGSVTVYKAPLTILPKSLSIHVGDPLPTLTYSISGFVNGDTQTSATTGAPTLTTATSTNTPGRYYIIPSAGSLAAKNYYVATTPTADYGILTILPN